MNEIEKAIEGIKRFKDISMNKAEQSKEDIISIHYNQIVKDCELAIEALEKQVELKKYLHYLQGFIKYDTLQIYEVADRIEEFIVEEIYE